MFKLTYLTAEQALQLVCLIKDNFEDDEWIIAGDYRRIHVSANDSVSKRRFTKLVKQFMGIDLKWQDLQLSIAWEGGVK